MRELLNALLKSRYIHHHIELQLVSTSKKEGKKEGRKEGRKDGNLNEFSIQPM